MRLDSCQKSQFPPQSVLVDPAATAQSPSMIHTIQVGGIAILVSTFGLMAQDAPANPSPAGLVTGNESASTLETRISQREERLAELGKDIVDLDTRIEKRIDAIIKTVTSVPETGETGDDVKQAKKDALEALKRGAAAYKAKRGEVADANASGDSQIQKDLGKFDERIAKRVEQIGELSKTIPSDSDASPEEFQGASYWNGFFYESNRLRQESPKQEAGAKPAGKESNADIATVQKAIDMLEKRRESLKSLLSNRKATEAAKQLYTRDLGKLDANKFHLREQLRKLTAAAIRDGKTVPTNPAHDLTQLLDDARGDLREDISRLFRTYDQFAENRTYLGQLKTELEARKAAKGR